MLKMREKYYKKTENYLELLFYDTFYKPILGILKGNDLMPEKVLLNKLNSLILAISKGVVTFDNDEFKGSFNISMSKELNKFADFDSRTKTWKVKDFSKVPSSVIAASVEMKRKTDQLNEELQTFFDGLEERFEYGIEPKLDTPIGETIDGFQSEVTKDLESISIEVQLTEEQKNNLIEDYNNNQSLSIKKWNNEQVQRLRDAVSKIQFTGYNKSSLRDILMYEWNVSKNKAQFLSRQETSLLLSKFRREQNLKAGVRKYKWSTSLDERVRPEDGNKFTPGNNHKRLHGKVFFYGDPPIVDTKTGRRAEPGEDFNCRCIAIPVI